MTQHRPKAGVVVSAAENVVARNGNVHFLPVASDCRVRSVRVTR